MKEKSDKYILGLLKDMKRDVERNWTPMAKKDGGGLLYGFNALVEEFEWRTRDTMSYAEWRTRNTNCDDE